MAKQLAGENASLKTQLETQKTQYEENTKQQTATLKKSMDRIKGMKTELEETTSNLQKFQHIYQQHLDLTGLETADELTDWIEKKAQSAQEDQLQQDAVRMLGELQIKTNLLEEQLAKIRQEGYKVSKSKAKKGLSGSHRQEKLDVGKLEVFHPDRCCAMVWADGKGSQCSRHWDKNPDGTWSKVCKTHQKHISADGKTWTGSFGLYHLCRPATWGEHGLYVQNEYKSRTGKGICWKMKQAEYLPQFESKEFQDSIPDDVPFYNFPEKVNEPKKVLAEFSSDEEDEDDHQTIAFSDSDGGNDVADLNDVADVETPDGTDEEVAVVEEAVDESVEAPDFEAEEEAQESEEEKQEESTEDDEEVCGKCGFQMSEAHGAIDGVEMCFDCFRQAEYDAQNLKNSSDEESE